MDLEKIKGLRSLTGAGIMACQEALREADGNLDRATKILREAGHRIAEAKAHRPTREGRIGSYLHHNGRIASIVEVQCESDFVARSEDFTLFVKQIAQQVAAMSPVALKADDLPQDALAQAREKGNEKEFIAEKCLLEQSFVVADGTITVGQALAELVGKIKENIVIRRFVRFELGEET